MKCGKCKKEGVTNEHVRECYGLRPRQTSNTKPRQEIDDIYREIDAVNEAWLQEDARQQAERKRKRAEERKAAEQEAARLSSEAQKTMEELDRQRQASECKACGRVPDINGRCNCS